MDIILFVIFLMFEAVKESDVFVFVKKEIVFIFCVYYIFAFMVAMNEDSVYLK